MLGPSIAGLIAVQLATIVGYFLRGIGLPQVPWPLFNGALFAPTGEFGSPASFFVGQSIHMVDGVVFAILFVVLVRSKIPLPNTNMGNIGKGLIYSMVMAIISAGDSDAERPNARAATTSAWKMRFMGTPEL